MLAVGALRAFARGPVPPPAVRSPRYDIPAPAAAGSVRTAVHFRISRRTRCRAPAGWRGRRASQCARRLAAKDTRQSGRPSGLVLRIAGSRWLEARIQVAVIPGVRALHEVLLRVSEKLEPRRARIQAQHSQRYGALVARRNVHGQALHGHAPFARSQVGEPDQAEGKRRRRVAAGGAGDGRPAVLPMAQVARAGRPAKGCIPGWLRCSLPPGSTPGIAGEGRAGSVRGTPGARCAARRRRRRAGPGPPAPAAPPGGRTAPPAAPRARRRPFGAARMRRVTLRSRSQAWRVSRVPRISSAKFSAVSASSSSPGSNNAGRRASFRNSSMAPRICSGPWGALRGGGCIGPPILAPCGARLATLRRTPAKRPAAGPKACPHKHWIPALQCAILNGSDGYHHRQRRMD